MEQQIIFAVDETIEQIPFKQQHGHQLLLSSCLLKDDIILRTSSSERLLFFMIQSLQFLFVLEKNGDHGEVHEIDSKNRICQ